MQSETGLHFWIPLSQNNTNQFDLFLPLKTTIPAYKISLLKEFTLQNPSLALFYLLYTLAQKS